MRSVRVGDDADLAVLDCTPDVLGRRSECQLELGVVARPHRVTQRTEHSAIGSRARVRLRLYTRVYTPPACILRLYT